MISLLAVCISFLLITAVWVQLGSSDISQALGSEGKDDKSALIMEARFGNNGDLDLSVLQGDKRISSTKIKMNGRKLNPSSLNKRLGWLKQKYPKISTGIVLPAANSSLEDIITTVDVIRGNRISDVGVAPLGS